MVSVKNESGMPMPTKAFDNLGFKPWLMARILPEIMGAIAACKTLTFTKSDISFFNK